MNKCNKYISIYIYIIIMYEYGEYVLTTAKPPFGPGEFNPWPPRCRCQSPHGPDAFSRVFSRASNLKVYTILLFVLFQTRKL